MGGPFRGAGGGVGSPRESAGKPPGHMDPFRQVSNGTGLLRRPGKGGLSAQEGKEGPSATGVCPRGPQFPETLSSRISLRRFGEGNSVRGRRQTGM